MTVRAYYIYVLTNNSNTTLYIEITNNISRRVYEHKNELEQGFSKKYKLHKLIHVDEFSDSLEAITREKQRKNWHRAWKINLVQVSNPV